tara:strand:+ start:1104 stop:1796 length:693 start_codon:yes stop_codon:yes gene_type:complete
MRLNKFLTKAGVCSRRKAEHLINEGRVTVNGKRAQITTAVGLEDQVKVDGRSVILKGSQNYETYAFYKPRGVICTLSPKERPNLKDCLPMEGHFFPVGRLDKESEGLLIVTSDGELANKLTHPSFEHEKEYLVWLHSDFDDQFLNNLLEGVVLDGKLANVTSTDRLSKNKFKVTLTEGRNRQIRRMVELLGHDVQKLKRVRIGAFLLSLKNGEYKRLGKTEILRLQKPIK